MKVGSCTCSRNEIGIPVAAGHVEIRGIPPQGYCAVIYAVINTEDTTSTRCLEKIEVANYGCCRIQVNSIVLSCSAGIRPGIYENVILNGISHTRSESSESISGNRPTEDR